MNFKIKISLLFATVIMVSNLAFGAKLLVQLVNLNVSPAPAFVTFILNGSYNNNPIPNFPKNITSKDFAELTDIYPAMDSYPATVNSLSYTLSDQNYNVFGSGYCINNTKITLAANETQIYTLSGNDPYNLKCIAS